ncbi:amidohydrolase 2 [Coprinopsis cinerea okayama7|uniref:Amidohydrolase 2 n=1 Tax=Coprinopsis cinerea (strain Okayama-7 / 130 / ATCC MYA-4618 / FGSC 9003) TaxID=240176 RepID=A8NXQ2_COPC7|nr:amidohydrolase 2 [Coprinopsis cinerea okayama7\|eukprot:XP_001837234.1 amidohydrolase 2 [Coprinopsis cinerea okayama7\
MLCVDVHHHYFSSDLKDHKKRTNDKIGWKTPEGNLGWSPELSLKLMDASGVDISILSFPAIAAGEVSPKNRSLARERNRFAAQICAKHPSRFGFFATLPFLDDVQGCLAEISYALDELRADGIALPSHCGEGYIGDDRFDRIWQELNRRRTVVFLHGTQTESSTPFPHPWLGIPITEVCNETFKAASHLVVTGRKRRYSDTKIILSHMGGSLPSLAARVAVLSNYMGCPLTPEEILEDFRSFYFDTALSSYGPNLQAMEAFALPDRLLFGTDLPAVDVSSAQWFTGKLKEHCVHDPAKLRRIMSENALKLFPNKALGMQVEIN